MELEFIKNLAQIMNDAGLGELEYRQGTDSLVLRTKSNAYSNMLSSHLLGPNIENINQEKLSNISFESQNNMGNDNMNMGPISSDNSSNVGECPSDKVDQPELKDITSTMIGTFYTSPSPDEPAFAKVGDKIKKGQVVCIIESTKLMNEVKSCFDCEIVEVLVEDQEVVEFGQALFRVREV